MVFLLIRIILLSAENTEWWKLYIFEKQTLQILRRDKELLNWHFHGDFVILAK